MAVAKFLSKDQHWQDETSVYWFDLEGETVGVSERGPESKIVDRNGMPMTEGDGETIKAHRACIVTDEMRAGLCSAVSTTEPAGSRYARRSAWQTQGDRREI